jgi:D-beta-D-heptose 7-phosphate kinase/D-beta-D-heptose 1-phosphate adenosyltransferase
MKKVIINGCFDMLHLGHVKLLEFASLIPFSFVYVLIDSDRRIKELKGQRRPVYGEHERVFLLQSLKYVDRVEVFDSDLELTNKIKEFAPDIMIKGSDYKDKPIIGKEYCKEIIFYERIDQYSTTNKIQSIIDWGKLY